MFEIEDVVELAHGAGDKIMSIYKEDFDVSLKGDKSPLTQADLESHNYICNGLSQMTPDIPVLSEESGSMEFEARKNWEKYWLIDPLDGTKEFVKKNGEFTVNIALIEKGRVTFGVVYAPAQRKTYIGKVDEGAWVMDGGEHKRRISVSEPPEENGVWRIVGSRSHQSEGFKRFIGSFSESEVVSMGSSLKLCLVAEGKADLYPRLGLTSEWDTAAAQAVVEGAGGQVLDAKNLEPLKYNTRDTLLNPFFIVCAKKHSVWAGN